MGFCIPLVHPVGWPEVLRPESGAATIVEEFIPHVSACTCAISSETDIATDVFGRRKGSGIIFGLIIFGLIIFGIGWIFQIGWLSNRVDRPAMGAMGMIRAKTGLEWSQSQIQKKHKQ